jgi:hypothetical protein
MRVDFSLFSGCSPQSIISIEGQGGSDDYKEAINTKGMACSGTLYASSGWDWLSLFIIQNDHRGYPAGEYGKLVDFRVSDHLVTLVSGTGKYAGKGRTN